MPFSQAQHKLFEARAHGATFPMAAKIPVAKASRMAQEGIRPSNAKSSGGVTISQRQATDAVPMSLKRQTKPQRLAMALSKYSGKANLPGV